MVREWNPAERSARSRGKNVQGAFDFLGEQAKSGQPFPVHEIDPEQLAGAVFRWVALGRAISFGLSGDGGAFGVHLVVNGDKRSKWFGTVSEAEDFLTTVPGPASAT